MLTWSWPFCKDREWPRDNSNLCTLDYIVYRLTISLSVENSVIAVLIARTHNQNICCAVFLIRFYQSHAFHDNHYIITRYKSIAELTIHKGIKHHSNTSIIRCNVLVLFDFEISREHCKSLWHMHIITKLERYGIYPTQCLLFVKQISNLMETLFITIVGALRKPTLGHLRQV